MESKTKSTLCCLLITCLIFGGMVFGMIPNPFIPDSDNETITTTTTDITDTTTTTTTPTTTTTSPPELDQYKIKFSFLWGPDIAEDDKCWVEFAAYDRDDITPSGKRDQVTLGAGHGDTGDWFFGSWNEIFSEGELLSVAMESYSSWYDFEFHEPFDMSVGPWSHSFTFYSYKYGFSVIMTSELRITWELV